VVDVLAVRTRVGEPLEAFWTLERLLPGMEPSMFSQMVLVLESLVAIATFVRTLVWKGENNRFVER
jgi:hypothetical protein